MDGMSERATPKTPMELNGSTLELNGFITLLKKNSKGEVVSTSHLNKAVGIVALGIGGRRSDIDCTRRGNEYRILHL